MLETLLNLMSDKARATLNTGLLWAILVTTVGGIYQAGRVYNRLETIEREMARVRPLEEDVIKIKAHLKLTAGEPRDTATAVNF